MIAIKMLSVLYAFCYIKSQKHLCDIVCPLSSNRQHYEIDDCLEENREDY